MTGYLLPYKLASVHRLKGGRLQISFGCNDGEKIKEIRKTFGLNRIKNKKKRSAVCASICNDINLALENGWNYFDTKEKLRLYEALDLGLEISEKFLKPNSIRSYASTVRIFKRYAPDMKIEALDRFFIERFILHRKDSASNKTINSNIEYLRSIFEHLVRLGHVQENPLKDVRKLKITTKARRAYSEEELNLIFEALEVDPHFRLFCLFIFYANIRPYHLRKFKAYQINYRLDTITTEGTNNKNSKSATKQLLQPLKRELLALEIEKLPPDHYIFGTSFLPSTTHCENLTTRGRERWEKYIKKGLGIQGIMYELKHSFGQIMQQRGASSLWIQQQYEHGDLKQLESYLRTSQAIRINEHDYNVPDFSK